MKRLNLLMVFSLLLSLVCFQSCDNEKDSTSRVQLKLIDEPGGFLEVNVQIIDVQYNVSDSEEGWQSFAQPEGGYPPQVDLTELIAGNSLLLADEIIPAGMLKQIRLVLGENNTLVIEGENGEAGEPIHLDTPSALQSGLKLNLNEQLEPGFTYTFILDWVVQESVVESGTSGMYNLKPVIKVNAEVNSGSISGHVVTTVGDMQEPVGNVVVEVYSDPENVLITDTMTNETGDFLIGGLAPGSYKLKISHEGYNLYESEVLNVVVGEILTAGTIELVATE